MNQQQFFETMNRMLRDGARDLDAATITAAMIQGLATIVACGVSQTNSQPEAVIEVVRNDLDIQFTRFLRTYRNAKHKTA
jgi:hypothetical protein